MGCTMKGRSGRTIAVLIILGFVALAPLSAALAKKKTSNEYSHNAIFVEALGPGVLYSIDYDHRFTRNLSVRVGYSSWNVPFDPGFFNDEVKFKGFPVAVNYLYGNGLNHLELGIGFEPAFINSRGNFFNRIFAGSGSGVLGIATIGYRFQPRYGLFFRIGFTPLFTFRRIAPYGGLSIGAAF